MKTFPNNYVSEYNTRIFIEIQKYPTPRKVRFTIPNIQQKNDQVWKKKEKI